MCRKAPFSSREKQSLLIGNQKNKKQCYQLIYFPEKKMKTGLEKTLPLTGGAKRRNGAFFSLFADAWKQGRQSSALGYASSRDFLVAGEVLELIIQQTAEHECGEERSREEPGLQVVAEE